MPRTRTLLVSAFAIAALTGATSAWAQQGPGFPHHAPGEGPMMMAQGGPGGGPGAGSGPHMMDRERRGGDDRDARHERRMQHFAERRIELLDTDGDGKISVEEIVAEQKRLFTAADVDGDGKLSADEFRRRGHWFVRLGTTSFFDMMDADGDQHLSATELTGPSERWFKRYDADNSGAIEAQEYIDARGHGGPRRGGR